MTLLTSINNVEVSMKALTIISIVYYNVDVVRFTRYIYRYLTETTTDYWPKNLDLLLSHKQAHSIYKDVA